MSNLTVSHLLILINYHKKTFLSSAQLVFYYLIKTPFLVFFSKLYKSLTIKSDTWPMVWLTVLFCCQSFHIDSHLEPILLDPCFKISTNLFKKAIIHFLLFCSFGQLFVWKESFFWEVVYKLTFFEATISKSSLSLYSEFVNLHRQIGYETRPLGRKFAVQIRMEPKEKVHFFSFFIFYFSTNDSQHL